MKTYLFSFTLLFVGCVDPGKDYSEIAQHLKHCDVLERGFLSEYSIKRDSTNSICVYSLGTVFYDQKLVCQFNEEQQISVSKFYTELVTLKGTSISQDLRMDDTPWLKYEVSDKPVESPFEELIKNDVCRVLVRA